MKKMLKKVFSTAMVAAMLFTSSASTAGVTVNAATGITDSGGWNETAYAEWAPVSGATSYDVYSKKAGDSDSEYQKADSELVRVNADTGNIRVDIPGLLGDTQYDLKIVPNAGNALTTTVTTLAHDRSGYAHFNHTEGVGAYNDDGTIKDNAVIVYVDDNNKDTVTIPGYENYANSQGIGWILNNNLNIMKAITAEHPLVIRIIGKVTPPQGLTGYNSTENGGTVGDNGFMAIIKNAQNVTIEGIGYDAEINGWGISLYHSASMTNGGKNYEVRNLIFRDYPEDAIGMQGEMSGGALTTPIERCWIHNNKFYPGYAEKPTESDKAQGDGSCDFKRGRYYTLSYNYFENCKKTNLIGASDSNLQFDITIHHNWWKDCASRGPLVRQSNIHIYNNFYDGTTSKAIDARAKAYVLSEGNYFDTSKNPYVTASNAVIKSYNDVLYNTAETSGMAVTKVTDREQTVANNCVYSSFDTDPSIFYYDSVNKKSNVSRLTDAVTARAEAKAYSGVMKQVPAIPTRDYIFSATPSSAVALPYLADFTDTEAGITMSAGLNILERVMFTTTKSFKSTSPNGGITVKGEGALFKVSTTAKVTVRDGAGGYTTVLVNSDGVVLAELSSGETKTVIVPEGVYAVQSSNNQKEAKIAALIIQSENGEIVIPDPEPNPDPGPVDPVDPTDPVNPEDPEPLEGCVAMGTYNLNSTTIPSKACTVNNFVFKLRSTESASVKLRNDNSITFAVDRACTLETDPAGKGITLKSSNGTITYNGSTSQTVTTSAGSQSFTLTEGTYTITGSESGSNTEISKIVLK